MNYKKLGDYITEFSQKYDPQLNYPVYSVTNNNGFCTEYFNKDVSGEDKSKYKVVPRGYFAYNPSRINVGSVDWQKEEENVIVSPLYVIFKCSDKLNKDYLKYFLRSNDGKAIIASKVSGSVRNNLNFKALSSIEFNIGTIEEQNTIVGHLKEIENAITNEKNQISLYDELIKARFVEMFGDPILNQIGFPVFRMDEVVDFQGGSQPDKKYFEYEPTDDNIRLIQIRDYKSDKYITYIPKALAKRFCTVDDIMIGRYGPPIFQILQGIEGSFNVALMKATPKMGNKEFIRYFLKQDCLLHYLEGLSKRTAGQDGIQMDKLKEYPFPMPPIETQEAFASLVKQIDKSKFEAEKRIKLYEELLNKKMSEYFMD